MVPKPLTINANTAPFKSSRLAIPPSPFSPRLPITPPATPPKAHHPRPSNKRALSSPVTPPPSAPLNWLWQCHVCYRAYPLGATRRCLDDGHLFCSGTTAVTKRKGKASRRTKRHRACASEFDYASWKTWGEWRRTENALVQLHRMDSNNDATDDDDAMSVDSGYVSNGDRASLPSQNLKEMTLPRKKDCWNHCDYPSECRWGSQYGVQSVSSTSSASSRTTTTVVSTPPSSNHSHNAEPVTSISTCTAQLSPSPLSIHTNNHSPTPETYTPPTTFDGILEGTPLASALATASASLSPTSPKDVRERFWDTLLDAARQRKRSSSSTTGSGGKRRGSPLATTAISASTLPAVAEEDELDLEIEGSGGAVNDMGTPTVRVVEDQDGGEVDMVDVPLFFDAVEEQPGLPVLLLHGDEDDLDPPAVPAPSLAYGTASNRSRGVIGGGRSFDFGFADKVQTALSPPPSPDAVVPVMSDWRGSGRQDIELKAGRSSGRGSGRPRRRLMRKSVLRV